MIKLLKSIDLQSIVENLNIIAFELNESLVEFILRVWFSVKSTPSLVFNEMNLTYLALEISFRLAK